MGVTPEEVRRVAALARIRLDESEVEGMARELGSILEHMEALAEARSGSGESEGQRTDVKGETPRPDDGEPDRLARPPTDFAPDFRAGHFALPRLATHEGAAGAEDEDPGASP